MLKPLVRWLCRRYASRFANQGDLHTAVKLWSIAIACGDTSPQTQRALGELHFRLGDYPRAIPLLESAAPHFTADSSLATMMAQAHQQAVKPDSAEAHFDLGNTSYEIGHHAEAIARYQRALALKPDFAKAHNNLGNVLNDIQRHEEAIASYRRALVLKPDFADFHFNLGYALNALKRPEEAIASYRRALALKPDFADAYNNLGQVLSSVKRYEEAIASYQQALALQPDLAVAHSSWVHLCQHLCAWSQVMPEIEALRERVTQGRSGKISPFSFLALPETDAQEQYLCARHFAQEQYRGFLSRPPLCGTGLRADRDRLRIGYLSADYHEHATSSLLAEVIERHDRNRFEVFGYSWGPDDASPMRRRMQAAFDTFREINRLSYEDAARQILDDRIDILVDLKGYTTNTRLPIMALRPAPVQVSWLGYPGTLGHPRLADYLIGDPIVSPLEHAAHYSETLALMPNCYQPNDRQRIIGEKPARTAAGLPADGFVFCCFNQSYKITPAMFDLWCRLLAEVPGSVLWLLQPTGAAEHNLRREAQARGVAAERIVFAPGRPLAEHLGRMQLADLALDTYPVASHTTASDALWAGVPLVARRGETFASRVAASIVNAAGLPELITTNPEEYYQLALGLATRPAQLAQIRARLAANRMSCPLFDSERFVRDLERLFRRMWVDYRAGSRQHIVIGTAEEDPPHEFSRSANIPGSVPMHHTQSTQTPALVQTLEEALACYRQGRLADAERLYQAVLRLDSDNFDALHLLGVLRAQQGRHDEAIGLISEALRRNPDSAEAHSNLGNALHELQRHDEAIASCRKALALKPDFAEAHYSLGKIFLEQNRIEEAKVCFEKALALKPDYAEARYKLANALRIQGKLDEALACYQMALLVNPNYAEAHNNEGVVYEEKGLWKEAIASYQRALSINPSLVDAHYNVGLLLAAQGDSAEALTSFKKAIALNPDFAEAHNAEGLLYSKKNQLNEAIASYQMALSVNPYFADSHNGLGVTLKLQGKPGDAIASFRKAISLRPDYFDAHYNLAGVLHGQGRLDEALASYKLAISLKPGFAEAHNSEGVVHGERGQLNEAIFCFQRALSIRPDFAAAQVNLGNAQVEHNETLHCYQKALSFDPEYVDARWAYTMAQIPPICEVDVDPKRFRSAFAAALTELASWFDSDSNRIARGFKAVGAQLPFYLAYQEENNKELLSRYGDLCVRIMRAWQAGQTFAPAIAHNSAKISIGVVSAHICEHSVWNAIIKGWLLQLDRSRFDLHLFHVGATQDQQTLLAQSRASSFEHGKRELPQWANAIYSKQLDVLIYPEIGMDAMTVKLASLRLASIQVATWGHPETSGLPTIDYFLSAEDFEPANEQEKQGGQGEQSAQENYTEQLVMLPHLGCCYLPSPVNASDPKLATLGIDLDSPILLCPGIAYKYQPQHDGTLVEIARRLGDCQIIFVVNGGRENWSAKLRRRLEIVFTRSGLDFAKYVVFIPWQTQAEFYGLLQQVDVFLDTIGFSGFNTAMQAIECGLPIVTRDGRFMRGRLASGILKRMGLPELIAESEEDYISLAVKLARDSEYRSHIRKRIEANRHVLFNDTAPIRALEDFLVNATRRQISC